MAVSSTPPAPRVGAAAGSSSYGELLRAYREPRMKQRPLARAVGLNPTLLNRSEKGTRQPADAAEVLAIAAALDLSADERDRLLAAAGYWPAVLQALGPGDLTLRAVAVVLADPSLSDDAKRAFRTAVESMGAAVAAVDRAGTPGGRRA
jgi:transcriptional regulator with XRE-family HTH domain